MPSFSKSEKRFNNIGFNSREVPGENEPKLPQVISQVNNVQLGDLMSKYGAWREYAEHQLAQATAQAAKIGEQYQFEWDKAYQRLSSGTETSKKRILGANQKLATHRQQLLESEIFRDLVASRVAAYNNALTVISREITRRGFTIENHA